MLKEFLDHCGTGLVIFVIATCVLIALIFYFGVGVPELSIVPVPCNG